MKVTCVLFLAAFAFAGAVNPNCFKKCPKIYLPVCGFNGATYQVFANECLMEEQTCSDAVPWSLAPMSYCQGRSKSCNLACPAIYLPVCGFNGQTYQVFPNKCVLEYNACADAVPWTLTTMDHCSVRSAKQCNMVCPLNYDPVCGFNGQTYQLFGNQCDFESNKCQAALDSVTWELMTLDDCAAHGLNAWPTL